MIQPSTRVHLLSGVPLVNDYKNQRTFDNANEQANYFLSKVRYSFTDFTYVRDGGYLRIPANYDRLYEINYVMFKNENYTDKWFYAFVTKREYVNTGLTYLYIELDVFQTWQFSFSLKECFVEREHGEVTLIDEGLDYGSDMNTVYFKQVKPYSDLKWLVIVSKSAMHSEANEVLPTVIGVPQPLSYYVLPFKLDGSIVNASTGTGGTNMTVQEILKAMYKNDNAVNNIVSLYVTDDIGAYYTYDGSVVQFADGSSQITKSVTINSGESSFACIYVEKLLNFKTTYTTVESKYTGLELYQEEKLNRYPYTQCILTDFKGNVFNIKLEMINGDNIILETKGSLGLSNKTSVNVSDYNTVNGLNINADFEHGFINSDPQDVAIVTDQLSAYLQGNRNSLNNQISQAQFNAVIDTAKIAPSLVTENRGEMIGGITDGVSSLGNNYYNLKSFTAKQQDIANVPPNLVNQGSNTAFTFGNGFDGYYIIKKQIKPEYATRLTMFFKMYGYQVNTVKRPNLKTRPYWNYVKTQNCLITDNLPQDDINTLQNMFNNGVTLWHGDWVGDYSNANY